MDNSILVERFKKLFRGRGDVWGHDEGRCVKQPVTDEHWQDHLTGRSGMGVYPAVPVPDGRVLCVWGCTDIDIEDYGRATLLADTLTQVGITSFIERSRSKGYHVWLFAAAPVSATDMRNLQLVAHQVADIPPIEVNPKQTDVTLGKYGNYVRLPYFGGLVDTPDRRVILDEHGDPMPLQQFVDMAYETLTPVATISQVAAMYQPPKPERASIDINELDDDIATVLRGISPLGYVVWRDGPLEGNDRSRTLMRLGHLCRDSGMSPSETMIVVRDADRRWGKFHHRDDCDMQLTNLVSRVFV
jgi:hypothetical protein